MLRGFARKSLSDWGLGWAGLGWLADLLSILSMSRRLFRVRDLGTVGQPRHGAELVQQREHCGGVGLRLRLEARDRRGRRDRFWRRLHQRRPLRGALPAGRLRERDDHRRRRARVFLRCLDGRRQLVVAAGRHACEHDELRLAAQVTAVRARQVARQVSITVDLDGHNYIS